MLPKICGRCCDGLPFPRLHVNRHPQQGPLCTFPFGLESDHELRGQNNEDIEKNPWTLSQLTRHNTALAGMYHAQRGLPGVQHKLGSSGERYYRASSLTTTRYDRMSDNQLLYLVRVHGALIHCYSSANANGAPLCIVAVVSQSITLTNAVLGRRDLLVLLGVRFLVPPSSPALKHFGL